MAKSRRNKSRRGGSGMIAIGGKSRRRRGGQLTGYAAPQSPASGTSLITDIGSGIDNIWQSTKKAVGTLGNAVTGSSAPAAPAPAGYGGRRRRRGGSTVVATKGVFGANAAPAKGGSRRRRRGGQPTGYSGSFGANAGAAKGGSRRRRKH